MDTEDILDAVREFVKHPYAWPGGYPLYLIMTDGAPLCAKCTEDNLDLICESTRGGERDGWEAAGIAVNWEDTDLVCEHCGDKIESAYGED